MIRRPPRSTLDRSSAASDVKKSQPKPTVTGDGRKAPALRFGALRVQALAGAIADMLMAVTGITNRTLRGWMTGLLNRPYSMNQASYDLSRLARNGLITRVPGRNSYTLTRDGLLFAHFYTKVYDHILRPLMAPDRPSAPPQLAAALDTLDQPVAAHRNDGLTPAGSLFRQLCGMTEAGRLTDPHGSTARGKHPQDLRKPPQTPAAGRGRIDHQTERVAHRQTSGTTGSGCARTSRSSPATCHNARPGVLSDAMSGQGSTAASVAPSISVHYVQVQTTTDSRAEAMELARAAVEARLAACAQVAGPIASTYWWEDGIERAEEWLLMPKLPAAGYQALADFLAQRHSYDEPEIVATPIVAGSDAYLSWIAEETRQV